MDPLEDALAEQRRRSASMTDALRHAHYGPGAGEPVPADASVASDGTEQDDPAPAEPVVDPPG
jgi:hypothetical protein